MFSFELGVRLPAIDELVDFEWVSGLEVVDRFYEQLRHALLALHSWVFLQTMLDCCFCFEGLFRCVPSGCTRGARSSRQFVGRICQQPLILARAYVCIMAGMVLPIHKTHQKEQGRLFVARLVLWSKASTVPLDGWRLRSTLRTSDEVLSPETGRPHAPTKKIVSPEFADANLWQQRQEWCATSPAISTGARVPPTVVQRSCGAPASSTVWWLNRNWRTFNVWV